MMWCLDPDRMTASVLTSDCSRAPGPRFAARGGGPGQGEVAGKDILEPGAARLSGPRSGACDEAPGVKGSARKLGLTVHGPKMGGAPAIVNSRPRQPGPSPRLCAAAQAAIA